MREYELTAIYNLAVAEGGGPDASVQLLSHVVEARGGSVIKVDHWGRRRLAYPIGPAIDGDYIVTRVELDPTAVRPLEEALRIDERVYRHLIVRADELPPPPVPRAPRRLPDSAPADAPSAAAVAPAAAATEPAAPPPAVDAVEAAVDAVAEAAPTVDAVDAAAEASMVTPAEPAATTDTPSEADQTSGG